MRLQSKTIVALIALALGSATLHARHATQVKSARQDNSRQNAVLARAEARNAALTADDQPNDDADRITAAKVRRVIVKDDTLSVYAHNVKVIVKGGQVTLEGPVHSQDERVEIALDAATVVRTESIVNRITVA